MIFDIIPDNFFSILSSPNKRVYWECIYKLFTVMNHQLSFAVSRDIITEELAYYFDSNLSLVIAEDEAERKGAAVSDGREKANYIIRKLQDSGWIHIEINNSHEQKVNFYDYAVELIKSLLSIANQEKVEYQGYIYVIYHLIRTETDKPGISLMQIYENTDKLITGLKNLNSNIKKYIDELTKHSTVAEIMDTLFEDYMVNIIDKAYHRLLTSDNVSKFRPEIIERLRARQKNQEYVKAAAADFAEVKEVSMIEAEEMVYDHLSSIVDAFDNMDDILTEIYKKSTQYQKAAVNRAKFLLSSSEDVKGQLKDILIYMNEQVNKEEVDLNSIYELEFIDQMIKLYSSSFLDENSLYTPLQGKKEFVPEELKEITIDEELRTAKRLLMAAKLEKVMSIGNITAYVDSVLQDRKVMLASEFPLTCDEDFIKLIYVRLYGQRKQMKYRVLTKDRIKKNGYNFCEFEVWRV